MKKIIFSTISILGTSLLFGGIVSAQGMMGFLNSSPDNATIQSQQQEEQEGKIFLDELKNQTIICSQLKDVDFEKIGEYFMGQSIGDTSRHIAMNEMMKGMMGEQGEEQAHIVMGKRLSGCDTSASFPVGSGGWMPMMNMMWGGWLSPFGSNNSTNNMMNFGFGSFGGFGWIFMVLWWVLIIAGIVALIKWLTSQSHGNHREEKSSLEILKERYAKGEIDKKEFEEKKKDLT
mgnify:CR=1 FL=1